MSLEVYFANILSGSSQPKTLLVVLYLSYHINTTHKNYTPIHDFIKINWCLLISLLSFLSPILYFFILDSRDMFFLHETCTLFVWLWLVAVADLLWEKSTAGWLVAGVDLVFEKNTTGWLAEIDLIFFSLLTLLQPQLFTYLITYLEG